MRWVSQGPNIKIQYKIHYKTNFCLFFFSDGNVLRVLNLNTWGLGWPISSDRQARFRALREVIAHSAYDVILLQEVWYSSDHELLRTALPYSTYFGIFNSGCSGYLLPLGCSGKKSILSFILVGQIKSIQSFQDFFSIWSFWSISKHYQPQMSFWKH